MYNAKNDPVTRSPSYVIAYTVEEAGTWRYIMVDGKTNLDYEFNTLYHRQDVMSLRVFGLNVVHSRVIVKEWSQDV